MGIFRWSDWSVVATGAEDVHGKDAFLDNDDIRPLKLSDRYNYFPPVIEMKTLAKAQLEHGRIGHTSLSGSQPPQPFPIGMPRPRHRRWA